MNKVTLILCKDNVIDQIFKQRECDFLLTRKRLSKQSTLIGHIFPTDFQLLTALLIDNIAIYDSMTITTELHVLNLRHGLNARTFYGKFRAEQAIGKYTYRIFTSNLFHFGTYSTSWEEKYRYNDTFYNYYGKTLTHEFARKFQIFELKSQNRNLNSLLCEIFTNLAVKFKKSGI